MSIAPRQPRESDVRGWCRSSWAWLALAGLCALCVPPTHARAQEPELGDVSPPAPLAEEPRAELPADALTQLRWAVDNAQFKAVQGRARVLLSRTDLSARQRNDTLELLAISQIAAREDAAARVTLAELFIRDPDHTPRVRDPGPSVEAMFERLRDETSPRPLVGLTVSAWRDAHGRLVVDVALGPGRDAADTVHVFARSEGLVGSEESASGSRVPRATVSPLEASHVVAEVGLRDTLSMVLPPAPHGTRVVSLHAEARAPSGAVLGSDGTALAPLRVQLGPALSCLERVPLRRRWWVWTSAAVVLSGIAVGAGIAAR